MILATTVHDPTGGLAAMIERHFGLLKTLFDSTVVVATDTTHMDIHDLLKSHATHFEITAQGHVGATYRKALGTAVVRGDVFLCDLDRILHWVAHYPDELKNILRGLARKEWVVFERTQRATSTHHTPLVYSEKVFHSFIAQLLGEPVHDYLSSADYFSQNTLHTLLSSVTHDDCGWYGEHATTLRLQGVVPEYMQCEGLEWETPDRFQKEILAAGGFDPWKSALEEQDEWIRRCQMLNEFINGTLTAWKRTKK